MRLADPEITIALIEVLLTAMSLTQQGISAKTPLGAGGRQLSGGERRRLCLARAIARAHGSYCWMSPPKESTSRRRSSC
jgi:ATP-binding cassette subfamily C protein CydC